jgi:hypothetical protein
MPASTNLDEGEFTEGHELDRNTNVPVNRSPPNRWQKSSASAGLPQQYRT